MISLYKKKEQEFPSEQFTPEKVAEVIKRGKLNLCDSNHDIKATIKKIRELKLNGNLDEAKNLKGMLPIITFSAEFSGQRKSNAEKKYSNLICLDFDKCDLEKVAQFRDWEFTKMLFISPSGDGFKLVVTVDSTEKQHTRVVKALILYFKETHNLEADAACTDVARACFLSYDENVYYNDNAFEIDTKALLDKYKNIIDPVTVKSTKVKINDSEEQVKAVIDEIVKQGIDITSTYEKWIQVGFALKSLESENGLDYFHALSQFHPSYNETITTVKWNQLDSTPPTNPISVATLFKIAAEHGISCKYSGNITNSDDGKDAVILRHLSEKYKFRINSLSKTLEYFENNSWYPISDHILNKWWFEVKQLEYSYLTAKGESKIEKVNINPTYLKNLIYRDDFAPMTNPIFERFKEIEVMADGTQSEIIKWINAFECNNSKIAEMYWQSWFCGCIENLMSDTYYDKLLVLRGGQNIGKTTAVEQRLAKPFIEYVSRNFTWDDTNKDNMLQMATNFVIFDDELTATTNAKIESIKKLTSTKAINGIRRPYAPFPENFTRICNFIACTNQTSFLSDYTGLRRFLVLDIVSIDHDVLNSIDYNLLWAQVWHKYHVNGEKVKLDMNLINSENEKYRRIALEEEWLREYFDLENKSNAKVEYMQTSEILSYLSYKDCAIKQDQRTLNTISSILNSCGIERKRKKIYGKAKDVWFIRKAQYIPDTSSKSDETKESGECMFSDI